VILGSLVRGAVGNARRSLDEISRAVSDRRSVQIESTPGDLVRLSVEQCVQLLAEGTVGRIAYLARTKVPDIVPINYLWYDGAIWVRSAPGPKMQAAERLDTVAFEVDRVNEQSQVGWSVVVLGKLRVADPGQLPPGIGPEPWAKGTRRHVLRIDPERIDGRRLLE
jgi:hypothetical protein